MYENAQKPLKLPIESADLPTLDERVAEAICLEHHHSILQFVQTFLEFRWTTEQITHVAATWPWPWLARAVAWERQKLGREPTSAASLAALEKLRAEQTDVREVPPQPPAMS